MTLPLYGTATVIRSDASERHPLRLQVHSTSPALHDAALVRDQADLSSALSRGFGQVVLIGDAAVRAVEDAPIAAYKVADQFGYLSDGDVIGIDPKSGRFRVHYRRTSQHNSFLVTERCNHYCLMCSQPPKNIDDSWILAEIERVLPLIDRETKTLGFTGGEPLLNWEKFIDLLRLCREHLPETAVHVLSNGRAFAQSQIADAWAGIKHHDLMVGIPLYASIDHVHDYVVQAEGAFDETILGILKLKDRGGRVEVRVVLHALTIPHLQETCRWIGRNLPFVDHVALMGLENTGFAIANDRELWIDPIDYRDVLAESLLDLEGFSLPLSIYNLPLCVLREDVRQYAVKSISDWKNGYDRECDGCELRGSCCGVFTSGRPKRSRGIRAVKNSVC